MSRIPDIDAFEERAAIAEYDGGLSRREAENLAARAQGFADADDYWQWLADYVTTKKIPA
ncbi:hypothetical protein [Shimia abyssi]|uniref:Uncharacterized protein n=1 Tax=Shimia abyssi TaxID=1662395 RepID=A0A2P8FIV2_9RHOB|nr:hypothetical protein [Shimia abyssi]PSL21641.1 hypothetical protein CLV88_10164 [Shimia abyssi]